VNSLRKLDISGFRFGIELELNLNTRNVDKHMKLDKDWWCHEEHCGTEIVSPRLRGYSGLMSVRRQLRYVHDYAEKRGLSNIGMDNAGLHVHVDIQDFTLGNAKRLLKLARRFNDIMFAIMDGNRFNNRYTRQLTYKEDKVDSCITLADIQSLQNHGRYSCVNMHAFPKHGTVEFRYAGATVDWQKVYSITTLYLRMVAFAKSDEEIPEYSHDAWESPGLRYGQKKLDRMSAGKTAFFNALQISGGTLVVLNELFDSNKSEKVKQTKAEKMGKEKYPLSLRSK
jgi:putative amidoligase enzyme